MSIDFRMRGRMRTQYLLAGGDAYVPGQALLVLCSWATSSLLLHYSFTTLSLLLDLRSSFAQPSPDLRSSSDRTSLRADGDAWWWRRGCLRTRLCQRGIHKKSVNSLDVVPATEALALPINLETTTRSPRRYNKRG